MKNMKVSYKLIVSFLIVVILATTVGVVGIIGMMNINEAKTTMYYTKTIPLPHIGKAEGELQYIRVNVREMYISSLADDQAGVEESWRYIEAMVPKLKAELDNFEDAATDADALAFYQKARQTYDNQLTPVVIAIRDAARVGDFETIERRLNDCRNFSNQIIDDFEKAIDSLIGAAKESYQTADVMANTMLTVIIVVLVIAVAFSMFLAFYISSLIAKPLGIMAGAFSAIGARGSLTFDAVTTKAIHDTVQRKDELGDCARGFEGIIEHLGEIERNLVDIASGDLTAEVHILSDEDDIGKSLQSTLDNLNTMFSDITSASGQVSTGSKQIADGAQSLAQGSTEQAASVQELSASIGEIAQKTKENAGMAERAALLAGTIMQNAERGNAQMGDMTDAVKEINQASQSISKVIKVIDDIAFQTNILALNAAVEAARAGQHGKGFAVVAEEVRNLAAKSAEAAKDTGGLIQNSMEKAELGARIAGETAESLAEIVSGINESSQIVGEIAKSSEEQSLGIAQINTGIDQVAQVVQQNSATAEQSAAASEEMSSQSSMLEDLISQFKLKNKGFGPSLPAKKQAAKEYSPPAEDSSYDMHGSDDFGKY